MSLSPMMQQYFDVKSQHPDCILMFRVGDFYEMFFDDAKNVSRELELVLTGKDCGMADRAPMCGVPFHAVESYVTRLIEKGHRVAICEQTEDPATAKGLVKRDVIRIISPGTVIDGGYLNEDRNNFLCSLYFDSDGCGAVFADISTGEIQATDIIDDPEYQKLYSEAASFSPSELICGKSTPDCVKNTFSDKHNCLITPSNEGVFNDESVAEIIEKQFSTGQINPKSRPAFALAALMRFLNDTQKIDLSYIKTVNLYQTEKFLSLDTTTRRNLELCETMRTKEKRGSLLWVLDKTKTASGARLIRQWIEKPLLNTKEIQTRQKAVSELFSNMVKRNDIIESLKNIVDIERLLTRLVFGTANARDLLTLTQTIEVLPKIKSNLSEFKSPLLVTLFNGLDLLEEVGKSIFETISEDAPITLREGGIIKKGASAAVDELRAMMNDGKNFISRIEQTEKEKTGIRSLKVGYNKIFGYYIEISKSFMNEVPKTYIRRQTLSNCERYVTEELKEMESRIIGAKERDSALEYELFVQLRENILKSKDKIRQTSAVLAYTDTLCSLASVASDGNYICPEVDYTDTLFIKDGRHPVVEKFTKDKYFVPNDCNINCGADRIMLITGPNMAGKSTYMRQIALIALMAQIGSFVPATEARIGVCDKIFTRVGASDDLSSGDSTFMLEMKEVANILKNATAKSLIIYDEIGRGTSTFDGMSIARAVLEYTSDKIGARTLFATHYHELTTLEKAGNGIKNYNIAAKKRGGEIIFLRKIISGGTDDSYGIEVAQLAGVPREVVTRARAVLKQLESSAPQKSEKPMCSNEYSDISFTDVTEQRITERLKQVDLNTITPIEAMSLLYELKKEI